MDSLVADVPSSRALHPPYFEFRIFILEGRKYILLDKLNSTRGTGWKKIQGT